MLAEEFVDGLVAAIGGARADRKRRGHEHPACRRIAIRQVFDDLQRRDRVQFGAPDGAGRPHAEEPLRMQRLDYGVGKASFTVAEFGVFIGDGRNLFRPLRQAVRVFHGDSSQSKMRIRFA